MCDLRNKPVAILLHDCLKLQELLSSKHRNLSSNRSSSDHEMTMSALLMQWQEQKTPPFAGARSPTRGKAT